MIWSISISIAYVKNIQSSFSRFTRHPALALRYFWRTPLRVGTSHVTLRNIACHPYIPSTTPRSTVQGSALSFTASHRETQQPGTCPDYVLRYFDLPDYVIRPPARTRQCSITISGTLQLSVSGRVDLDACFVSKITSDTSRVWRRNITGVGTEVTAGWMYGWRGRTDAIEPKLVTVLSPVLPISARNGGVEVLGAVVFLFFFL